MFVLFNLPPVDRRLSCPYLPQRPIAITSCSCVFVDVPANSVRSSQDAIFTKLEKFEGLFCFKPREDRCKRKTGVDQASPHERRAQWQEKSAMAAKGDKDQVVGAQTPAIIGIEEPLQDSPIYLGEEGTPVSNLELSSPSLSATTTQATALATEEKPVPAEGSGETMPTLRSMREAAAEQDSKVVLEDFDFHSKQLREELQTFKDSLMTMSSSATATPSPPTVERVYKQPEINPLHTGEHLREGSDENTASSEYSSPDRAESPAGTPKTVYESPMTSPAAPSLMGTPMTGVRGPGSGRDHSLERLSKVLRHNGFGLHFVGGDASAKVNGVVSAFFQVLNQYERRGKLIQEMIASNELSAKQEQRLESKARKMKVERDEARRDLNLLSEKFEAKLSRSMNEKRSASESKKVLGTEKERIQGKLTHLEHIVRAREKEIDQLRNKLRERTERDERRQRRDREIYDKLRHKVSRHSSGSVNAIVRELRVVEIVGIYESQREVLESELTALRTDLHATKARLDEKEKYILNKDMAGNWKTPAEGEILNSLAHSEKQAADAVRKLAEVEMRAADAAMASAKEVAEEQRKNEVLAEENASLILELESRPQLRDLQAAQRQIEMLERKVSSLGDGNKENLPQDVKRQMTRAASAKIRKDRKLFQLGLHKVQNLPHSVLVEIVQDACLKVELGDPTSLSQSLAKLLRIVAAVPRMERFVGAVCEITLQDGISFAPKDVKGSPEPKDVPRILQHWLSDLRKLKDLELLHSGLVGELQHRSSATRAKGRSTGGIMAAVKEMVVAERAFHQMKATFDNASQIMKDNPDELLSKIVAHFQRLFNCKNLEGTFAAINQAYLSLTESRNFIKALRNLVGLDRSAGINACLARVRQLVMLQAEKYANTLDEGKPKEEEQEKEQEEEEEGGEEEQEQEEDSQSEGEGSDGV